MNKKTLLLCACLSLLPLHQVMAAPAAKAVAVASAGQVIHVGVNGLVCDFCAQSLKKTFGKEAAVEKIDVSLTDKLVTVYLKPNQTMTDAKIKDIITKSGYDVTTIHHMPTGK
jgi:copper chaperone CopZ